MINIDELKLTLQIEDDIHISFVDKSEIDGKVIKIGIKDMTIAVEKIIPYAEIASYFRQDKNLDFKSATFIAYRNDRFYSYCQKIYETAEYANYDFSNTKDELDDLKERMKLPTEDVNINETRREINKIFARFKYAREQKEDKSSDARMHDIFAYMRRLIVDDSSNKFIPRLLGILLRYCHENDEATKYYALAGEHEMAFALASDTNVNKMRYAQDAILSCASLMGLWYVHKNSPMEQWDVYTKEMENMYSLSDGQKEIFVGFVAACLYKIGENIQWPNKENILHQQNIDYIALLVKKYTVKPASVFQDKEVKKAEGSVRLTAEGNETYEYDTTEFVDSTTVYTGIVKNYLENTYGFIQLDGSSDVFFHVNQVNDARLRYILSHGEGIGRTIKFKLGDNSLSGRGVAADDIRLSDSLLLDESIVNSSTRHEGYIIYYNRHGHYGKLQGEDNKDYTFQARNVVNPFLRAYLEDGYANNDWQVEYSLRGWNGILHANDITSLQEIPEDMINAWKQDMVISEREMLAWETYQYRAGQELSNDGLEDGIYIPLPPIRIKKVTKNKVANVSVDTGNSVPNENQERDWKGNLEEAKKLLSSDYGNSSNASFHNTDSSDENRKRIECFIDNIIVNLLEKHPSVTYDLSLIKKSFKESGVPGWDSVYSMFLDAVKNNSLITDKYKQKKLCGNCEEFLAYNPKCKPMYVLQGHILFIIGKLKDAADSFLKCGDYYNEALICIEGKNKQRLLSVISDIVLGKQTDVLNKLFANESSDSISELVQFVKENPISDNYRESVKSPLTEDADKLDIAVKRTDSTVTLRDVYQMFFSVDDPNPFRNLPHINEDQDYYKKACSFFLGDTEQGITVDLKQAEVLFIKSIQIERDEILEKVIANLVNIYTRLGKDYIKKGLQLLDEFGYFIGEDKLRKLQDTLIRSSKNEQALCKFLLYVVDSSEAFFDKATYIPRLVNSYFKEQKWEDMAYWSQQAIQLMEEYKGIQQGDHESLYMKKRFAIALYEMGDTNNAKKLAWDIISIMPDDYIAEQILNNTFKIQRDHEAEIFISEQITSSMFTNEALNNTNIFSILEKDVRNRRHIRTERIQDGRYIQDINRAARDNWYLMLEVLPILQDESDKYDLFLAMAKIQLDAVRNTRRGEHMGWVRVYIGIAMILHGDNVIRNNGHVDTATFYYTEGLRHLHSDSFLKRKLTQMSQRTQQDYTMYPTKALKGLIESFFATAEITSDSNNDDFIEKCFKRECYSVKNFIATVCKLNHIGSYEQDILKKIYNNREMFHRVMSFFHTILKTEDNAKTLMDFERIWGNARNKIASFRMELINEVETCYKEISMSEATKSHLQQLEKFKQTHLFSELDRIYLTKFIEIVQTMEEHRNPENTAGYILYYRNMLKALSSLIQNIDDKPTDVGYNVIRHCVKKFIDQNEANLNNLYAATKPEITKIALTSEEVFIKDGTALVSIVFRTQGARQTADGIEVKIISEDGAVQQELLSKFDFIRGGEQKELIVRFKLSDEIIEKKELVFDVEVGFSYYDGIGSSKSDAKRQHFVVQLERQESFKKIDNRYRRIWRGNGVQEPDMFKGRNKLIDDICSAMRLTDGDMVKNAGIVLWGQRRVGKNSVKDYLKDKIQKTYPGAYIPIEIGNIGDCESPQDLFSSIILCTELELMENHPDIYQQFHDAGLDVLPMNDQWNERYTFFFQYFMKKLMGILKNDNDSNKNIPLFYFDEFSYIYTWIHEHKIDGIQFMRFWKTFIAKYGICSIIIVQDNFPIWSAEYPNEFSCMDHTNQISYLDFEGVRALVCDPCSYDNVSLFSNDAVDYIYWLTQGSAFLIVILCKALVDYANESCVSLITKATVILVLDSQFVRMDFMDNRNIFERIDFDPQLGDALIINGKHQDITSENKIILSEIAKSTIAEDTVSVDKLDRLFSDQIPYQVFERLKQRGIITSEGMSFCKISMPLLKFYLLKEQGLMTYDLLWNC